MLFSRKDVADFINSSFEPVWQSVRPVPIVRIDFGDRRVITRTLHGNIATYVCTADGQVLDILPGIYARDAYMRQLDQFRLLAQYVGAEQDRSRVLLADYHQRQADALKTGRTPDQFEVVNPDFSKVIIESRLKAVLVPGKAAPADRSGVSGVNSPEEIADWKSLIDDTRLNETLRRRQIHEMLAVAGNVRPQAITKRLYRDVLHSDLDDPYLGLGSTLFASYPFKD